MIRLSGLAAVALLTSGCASQMGPFFNRPVVEDSVRDTLSTVSLSADRRTVIVANNTDPVTRFCAEPPPDTATGLKAGWEGTVKSAKAEVSLKDALETSVTVLSARNAPLDAFRSGLFSLCQFYLNGGIDKADIKPLFERLIGTYEVTQPRAAATGQTSAAGTEQRK